MPRTDNVWADLPSRWTAPRILRRLVTVRVFSSSSATDFEWPTIDDIATSQIHHDLERIDDLQLNSDGLYCNVDGAVWILRKLPTYSCAFASLRILAQAGIVLRRKLSTFFDNILHGTLLRRISTHSSAPVYIVYRQSDGGRYLGLMVQRFTARWQTTHFSLTR